MSPDAILFVVGLGAGFSLAKIFEHIRIFHKDLKRRRTIERMDGLIS